MRQIAGLFFAISIAFLFPLLAQQSGESEILALRAELERMHDTDQAGRSRIAAVSKEKGPMSEEVGALWQEQTTIDKANLSRLIEIIDEHGWPGKTMVGEKAASGAFLILQHADYEHQKKYLPLVQQAAAAGELEGQHLALLQDRILMREGKKQIYGTQLVSDPETGRWKLHPIEDEAGVDERRASVGLPPMSEYLKLFNLQYEKPEPPN